MRILDLIDKNTYVVKYMNHGYIPYSKRSIFDESDGHINHIKLCNKHIVILVEDDFELNPITLKEPEIEIIKEIYERVDITQKKKIVEYIIKCGPKSNEIDRSWMLSIVLGDKCDL